MSAEPTASLRTATLKGARWLGLAALLGTALQLLQLFLLARWLGKEALGLRALLESVFAIVLLLADAGISNAIVQKDQLEVRQLHSLYWFNLGLGLALAGILAVSAPLIAGAYHQPALASLLYWAAAALACIPFGQQYKALLQRNLAFATLARIELTGAITSTAVALGLALTTSLGAEIFAISLLARQAVQAAQFYWSGRSQYRLKLHFSWSDVRPFAGFGGWQLAASFAGIFGSYVDVLILGRVLDLRTLGLYGAAKDIAMRPLLILAPLLHRLIFPVLSRLQDNRAALGVAFDSAARMLAVLCLPVYLSLVAFPAPIIRIALGPGWEEAIPLLQLLALYGLCRTLLSLPWLLLLSLGHMRQLFAFSALMAVLHLATSLTLAPFGTLTLAASNLLLVLLFVLLADWLWVKPRLTGPTSYHWRVPLLFLLAAGAFLPATLGLFWVTWPALPALLTGIVLAGLLLLVLFRSFAHQELQWALEALPPILRDTASRFLRLPTP